MTEHRTMSHSQKEVRETCKRKWYYKYEKGIEEDKAKSEALIIGEYVHAILEQYMLEYHQHFDTQLLNENDLRRSASIALKSLDIKLKGNFILLGYELALQGLLTLKKDFKELVLLQPKGVPAIEITATVDNVYTGIIDLVYIDKRNRIVLLDWKTTSWGEGYTNHKIKQSKQLKGYAWLLESKGISVDMLAYCVLDKKMKTARIMKIRNTRNYVSFRREITKINKDIRLHRGKSSDSFQRNEEVCFAYRSECPFYELCWAQDQRVVETIDLVPSLS